MQPIALLFPGQGSQYIGMGKDLYETFPESKAVFDQADRILGFSLSKLCFEGPLENLTKTQYCQPAVFTVSIAALEALSSKQKEVISSARYSAGLSLGEYAALVASGVIGFEEGLRLVSKRARLMEEATHTYPGKMAAVLGLEGKLAADICAQTDAQIANRNCPGQIVISGKVEAVEKAKASLLASGAKRVIDLEVSGAFHSSLMKKAADEFKVFLDSFTFRMASLPIISNVTASSTRDTAVIRENLFRQIYSSVLWEDTVRFMADEGVKLLYEIGPGNVLKGLIRKIDSGLEVKNIAGVHDIEKETTIK